MRFGAAFLLAAASCWAATDYSLIEAVQRRDVKAAEALLAQHANVNAALPDGATALAWAVFLDLQDTAAKLIDAGANVNTRGDYGETPLSLALANGNAALVRRLLNAGADPNATRWNGETALMIAAGAGSVEEVKLLLDAGVAVHAAEECVQLHGGIGMTWEYPAHLYLNRAKSDQLALGTAYRHRARLAELVDLPPS